MDSLCAKIKTYATKLLKWNKEQFGKVSDKIRTLEEQLRIQYDVMSKRNILANIKEWRHREEILWWQRLELIV